jgi:hypothetical protein
LGVIVDALGIRIGSVDPRRAEIGQLLASREVAGAGRVPGGGVQFRVLEEIVEFVGFSDIGVGSEAEAGCGLAVAPGGRARDARSLHGLTQPGDYSGNVSGAQVAPSAGFWHSGTRDADEATLDQLHCVQCGEQALGAVETLETAHRSQARLQVAVISFAAIGRDHPVVETGSRVPGTWRCARMADE